MNLEVLIATMNNKDIPGLLKSMNVNSNSIVINQTDYYDVRTICYGDFISKILFVNERGLSRSRNLALSHSDSDLICLADEDLIYTDTYVEDIISEFNKYPDADGIVFCVETINARKKKPNFKRQGRIKPLEYKEFCSVEIVLKREKVIASNVWFNLLFGSGSTYKCGEETIFLKELLKKGFKIYKSDVKIASVDMNNSTWFSGYNNEFFFNKGAVVRVIYPRTWFFAIFILSIKNSVQKLNGIKDFHKIFNWYYEGVKDYQDKLTN